MDGRRSTGAIVGIIGGIVLVGGSLLTWGTGSLDVQALASAIGVDPAVVSAVVGDASRSISGIDVTGGQWALAMGILAAALGVLGLMKVSSRAVAVGLIVAGLVGGGWALYDTTQADNVKEQAIEKAVPRLGSIEGAPALIGQFVDTSLGAGIWISVVGGLIAIGGGVVLLTAGGSISSTDSSIPSAAGAGSGSPPPPPVAPPVSDRPSGPVMPVGETPATTPNAEEGPRSDGGPDAAV